ncbi:unnamed protein product [Brachionus calyciflorus]|uniref:RNA helicase n=1 Tax=Brachionus calyciflorus TaxID=104777 RepID=A0A813W672_9BILA|nr:unnamed protein product [Brachionus calyciflorus]
MLKNLENSDDVKKRTKDIELDENVLFEDLLLSKPVLDGLKNAGFLKPSPIQLKAIPLGKLGLDLIVQAKSGTGKTCVFSVISLEHILASKSKSLQVLILAPTREVAIQISDCIKSIGQSFAKCHCFIGGQSINQDKTKIKNCQIAVGTPGRINHLIEQNLLNTSNIRFFVLDEADKLLEPEFQDSINLIFSKLPENKQILFLSATYPEYMASYATRYMRSPTFVRLNIVDPSLRGIKQFYKITSYSNLSNKCFGYKIDELCKVLSSVQFQQAIIFVNYQIKAESLSSSLNERGWQSIYTSGHIEQNQRNFAMNQLKNFKCRILVSTDLTARGVDAQNVDLVVCMDLPTDPETYLHRIGRAGRYGCQGKAVSFVTEKEESAKFDEIIESYNLKIAQFNDGLDDIVLVKNEISDEQRKDDVTIEKVKLSKQQLDNSLFEYEKSKHTSHKYTSKTPLKQKKKISIISIEKIDIIFKNLNFDEPKTDSIDHIIDKRKFKVTNINSKLSTINKKLKNLILENEKDDTMDTKETTEMVNLNDLYKWEEVKRETPSKLETQEPSSYNLYDYFSYYYQYYFRKYLNN